MSDLILADLLYMTGLGLTMVFLFLKSRLSRRKTALIFAGTALSLMALEVILTYTFSVDLVVRLYSLIVYLPSFLVTAVSVPVRRPFLFRGSAHRRRRLLRLKSAGVGSVAHHTDPDPVYAVAALQASVPAGPSGTG